MNSPLAEALETLGSGNWYCFRLYVSSIQKAYSMFVFLNAGVLSLVQQPVPIGSLCYEERQEARHIQGPGLPAVATQASTGNGY